MRQAPRERKKRERQQDRETDLEKKQISTRNKR